jgi:BTB/POZ domain-containing protein KCTD3
MAIFNFRYFLDIPIQDYAQVALSQASAVSDPEASTSSGSSRQANALVRVPSDSSRSQNDVPTRHNHSHSRTSSWDLRVSRHSRNPSLDMRHSRNSSADLNKFVKNDLSLVFGQIQQNQNWVDPLRVQVIKAHHNWLAVAYSHFFICYRMKDSSGWKLVFTSPFVDQVIERIAINAKMNLTSSNETPLRMVAISYGSEIKLWGIGEDGEKSDIIGTFNLQVRVEFLFFIGNQLVALSSSGKIGVWHSNTRHFQIQDLLPILSFDHAGSFLLLGCTNGIQFKNQYL